MNFPSDMPTPVDSEKLTQFATELRRSQPAIDKTSADDMATELLNRKELLKFKTNKLAEFDDQRAKLTAQWKKLNNAIAAAEKQLTARPWLRSDIADWRREMESIEEDGAAVKRTLEGYENGVKAAKEMLKQLSEKNPRGFDYVKFERLKEEEAALKIR